MSLAITLNYREFIPLAPPSPAGWVDRHMSAFFNGKWGYEGGVLDMFITLYQMTENDQLRDLLEVLVNLPDYDDATPVIVLAIVETEDLEPVAVGNVKEVAAASDVFGFDMKIKIEEAG